MLAGGKVVKIDRVEWIAIVDPLTAVNALERGEIDLIEVPVPDLFPMLEGRQEHRALRLECARQPDHPALQPPASAVQQREGASGGHVRHCPGGFPARTGRQSEIYRVCNAPLVCGSPYEQSYGNLLIKPDYDKARQLLKESGL